MPPCWEGFSFGKPAHGHPVWTDGTARSLETSSADLDATYHTERRRVQLPPPLPKTDSASRLTRVSRQRPRIRARGTRNPATRASQGMWPLSWTRLTAASSATHLQQASGRSGGTSRSEQRRAPDWNPLAKLRTTVAGVGKKTWTFTWEPILGSITGRSQPPSGPN